MIIEYSVRAKFMIPSNKYGDYNSALYYTLDEWDDVTEQMVEDSAQALFDAWVFNIQNAVATVEPTLNELLSEKSSLESQLAQVNLKIQELS